MVGAKDRIGAAEYFKTRSNGKTPLRNRLPLLVTYISPCKNLRGGYTLLQEPLLPCPHSHENTRCSNEL
jgi:hypothetical protein